MRYFLIVGEASGDLHAANLIRAIKRRDPAAEFAFWGGDNMAEAAKTQPLKHYRELAFMGFVEVVANLRTIFSNLKLAKSQIAGFAPDSLILIDYPGFNLRIAPWAKRRGFRVHYYISPQIWAWKQSRVHGIKRNVDRMLTILPFESDFYRMYDMEVDFVGHPLLDAISERKPARRDEILGIKDQRPIIAILPGSRKQEIRSMLPTMLKMAERFPEYQFAIAGAPGQERSFYEPFHTGAVPVVFSRTYDLLSVAHAAVVTSGTATLETALFDVPEVVCYKGNAMSYSIARRLIKVDYISLVNLIADRPLVAELIQKEMNADRLEEELAGLLEGEGRQKILEGYAVLKKLLGGPGASDRAAGIIHQDIVK